MQYRELEVLHYRPEPTPDANQLRRSHNVGGKRSRATLLDFTEFLQKPRMVKSGSGEEQPKLCSTTCWPLSIRSIQRPTDPTSLSSEINYT
jgi:hypothetical protein